MTTAEVSDTDLTWELLLELPVRQRAAVFLRYYEDLSEQQAADVLECSVAALKSLVSRAMKTLRLRLQESDRWT